ncbi:amino acid permease [Clostridium tagluense]|uniref:APC family permease n=1 Tax=Clostridium tagluense TaxID=360422 RepID=UPI001C0E1253|nr:amino acid permease [Clostridium tagluense]MBU3130063.1 amino acid permease [Clostridium tagluense]MCB2313721.1 amino acid permease [Clostridium tagluense]MCB2318501.1 amino acid permease [Clostridium tagluense]MCB2323383.1 amino acid permease [Clostridium tagluense]MCB2328291.1 amino acid permease [Clostridium tagluense]
METSKKLNSINNSPKTLKKEIGLLEAITLVIGMVIGSGIFFKPSIVFKNAGSPTLGILAWVAGGIITMASALTIAEIAAAIPKTGGVFIYLKELYGEKVAFLFGWVQTVIYVPGAAAALAIVLATQATNFVPMNSIQQKLFAILMLFIITTANVISTKLGSKIQFVATIAKLIPIFIIIALGLIKGTAHSFSLPVGNAAAGAGFGAAMLGTLWAYDGWVGVGNIAGELKNPKKDIPKSIIFGLVVIIIVYVLFNLAIINIVPITAVISSNKVASDAATVLFGKSGSLFITAGILISIFGTLNGYLMTGVRIPFAMAQDKLLPFDKFIGKVNEKYQTPLNAFVFEVVIACLYVFSGSFDKLTNLVTFVLWIFFTMAVAGIFILRTKHKDLDRPYKVPLYPIIPLIGIIGGIYILISTLMTDTSNALTGLAITLIGLPVYWYIKKKK